MGEYRFCRFVIHQILNSIKAKFKEILFDPPFEYTYIHSVKSDGKL